MRRSRGNSVINYQEQIADRSIHVYGEVERDHPQSTSFRCPSRRPDLLREFRVIEG